MVTFQPGQTPPEVLGESFFIEFKEKKYGCRAYKAQGRILYQINFNGSYLYLTKSINQHGIPFWTSVPQDLKLRPVAAELGRQLENHLIASLCVTTTASK